MDSAIAVVITAKGETEEEELLNLSLSISTGISLKTWGKLGIEVSCVRIPLQQDAASPHGNTTDSWSPANRMPPHSQHTMQKKMRV